MSTTITTVAQRAATISTAFSELGVDVSPTSVEERIEAVIKYKVPENVAVETTVRGLITEYDLDSGDLPDDLAAYAGFSGRSNGSKAFDRTTLEDIPAIGDESWVDVRAQVVDLWEPKHDSMAQVGLIADETAQMKFVKWAKNTDDLPVLEEGVTYDFADVITNEYEGKFSVSLNKASTVTESAEPVEPTTGGVRATGTLVALEDGSGLIKRCPHEDCSRVVQNGRCSEHGEVDGEFDLRLKAILDDGERAIRALFNAEMTEAVTGVTLQEAKELAAETFDASVVAAAFSEQLIGRTFEVRGPVIGEYLFVDEVVATTYSEESPGLSDAALAEAVTQRQPAVRVLAAELGQATHSYTRPEDEDDERAPKFTLLPSGAAANRVLVVGALIETADVGRDSEFWKGRIVDPTGSVSVYAGQYQPDAMAFLRSAEPPCYVAVVGKIHHYETDHGVNVSLQPEHITVVDDEVRDSWVAEAIDHTRTRLEALEDGATDAADAVTSVYGEALPGVEAAIDEAVEDLSLEDRPAE